MSYNGETDFITAIRAINKLITPEIYKYREFTHKAFISYIIKNKIIEKVIDKRRGDRNKLDVED